MTLKSVSWNLGGFVAKKAKTSLSFIASVPRRVRVVAMRILPFGAQAPLPDTRGFFTPVRPHSTAFCWLVIAIGVGVALASIPDPIGFAAGCLIAAGGIWDLSATVRRNAGARRLAEQQQGESFES